MYNIGVPKLKYTKNSIGAIMKKAEQGIVLTKKEQEAYQFVVVTSNQLKTFTEGVRELTRGYTEALQSVSGVVKQLIEAQLLFAKHLEKLFEGLAAIEKITALIQVPKIVITPIKLGNLGTYSEIERPLRIFVQPDKPYIAPKYLPTPKRKYKLPLTAIQTEGKGFTIEGEYIRNITRKSLTGKVLELMIRADLKGNVSDKAIDEIIGTGSLKTDYVARCNTLRDLKEILAGNKLKLPLKRDRGIGRYKVNSIIRYIRKPRKAKRNILARKTN